jgi:hypothetical protein
MPDPLAKYDAIFQAAGTAWNVDPMLLKAMAGQESGGNPGAVSKAGAQGVMQIMPDTARTLGVTDPTDPVQSIYGGAKYMSEALDAEQSPEAALLYYHGGPGWRGAYGPESRGYVPAVSSRFQTLTQNATQPYVVGDSLAQGVAQAGSLEANATQGIGPQKVLSAITSPAMGSVLGRDVILSSGASNDPANPANADTIAQQIAELKARGARNVSLVGVGDHPSLTGVNDTLAAIAQKTGARFLPVDPATLAADRIHPKSLQAYRTLLAGPPAAPTQEAAAAPPPGPL